MDEIKVNDWYEFIDDKDLQTNESYHSMIKVCPTCGALFSEKACGMRTTFPWFGYHPTDGNCKVLQGTFVSDVETQAYHCMCKERSIRIKTSGSSLCPIKSLKNREKSI